MSDKTEYLTNRLIKERQKSLDFFSTLSPNDWECTIYTDGSCWTVHHVLAHFIAAEEGFLELIADILDGGAGSPEDFDLNAYNERKVQGLMDIPSSILIQRFFDVRQGTIILVSKMDDHDLAKVGRHPFLGRAPLVDIIKLIYRHNQIHIREVRKVIT